MIAQPQVAPGFYPGGGQASLLRSNGQQWLFQQQLNAAGKASIAVQLERIRAASYPFGASFQIYFTNSSGVAADPGTFEVDIQASDIDTDTQYSNLQVINSGLNASYSIGYEAPSFWAKFVRAYVKTLTNAVYVNVLVTR